MVGGSALGSNIDLAAAEEYRLEYMLDMAEAASSRWRRAAIVSSDNLALDSR